MNDPGVDSAIHDAAKDIETNPYQRQQQKEEEDEQDFLDPRHDPSRTPLYSLPFRLTSESRWWFASTACPLIAGTFGPMANAFSICALVENWRVYIPPTKDEAHGDAIKDPPWLIAINSVSLAFALIANLFLLLNMGRRVSFSIAQPITIFGFLLSSFLLIALVSVASSPIFRIDPTSEHALTQAFYYAIMAAAIYSLIAILMCLTVWGAHRGHYEKEFRLTVSQRTLMLQTISFMVYLLLGALVFKAVEGWQYLDAVYWADFTLFTVGIGDFSPSTHLGRSLLFPYAIGGIVMVGLVIGSIRSLVLDRGKRKMSARIREKKRERVLSSIDTEQRTIKTGLFRTVKFSQRGLTEPQRRQQEFLVMRKIQKDAESRRRWTALAASSFAAFALWFVGAIVFWKSERPQGWSYFQAMYFSYTSLLTIGYGDLSPISNAGKAFFVFWSLLAVPTLTILISNMGDTVVKAFSDFTIWLGSLTVLPGEHGIKTTLQMTASRITEHHLFKVEDFQTTKPPGITSKDANTKNTGGEKTDLEDKAMDRLTAHIEDEELLEAEEAGERGDPQERDFHFYHAVLAKELRKVLQDTKESPPKEYTYSEWAYYLKLIGEDESDPSKHRDPPIDVDHKKNRGPVLASAGRKDDNGNSKSWSWLGTRSPLMGTKTEAEWLVQRLSITLERELSKFNVPPQDREPPPISMADLRKRRTSSSSSHSATVETEERQQLSGAEIQVRKRAGRQD